MKDDNKISSTQLNNGTVPANIATPSGVTSDQILASSQSENLTMLLEQLEITEEPRSNLKISFLLLALFLSLFISALDATIVSTAVPVITHELNSAVGYTWIGASYLISNAIACPITAKLSDIWGRKSLMLGSVALFFIASTVCARANSMDALISGRVMQGIAGGSIILLVHIVISDVFSMRQRSLFMGLTEGIWATAGKSAILYSERSPVMIAQYSGFRFMVVKISGHNTKPHSCILKLNCTVLCLTYLLRRHWAPTRRCVFILFVAMVFLHQPANLCHCVYPSSLLPGCQA